MCFLNNIQGVSLQYMDGCYQQCVLDCSVVTNSFVAPWTVACQAPPSTGFSRQEYWNGLPFPFPGDRTQVSRFAGMPHFVSYLRNICLTQSHKDVSYISRCLRVLSITFRSMIHSELTCICYIMMKLLFLNRLICS